MKVVALSDSLAPWHSFWIRIGQYTTELPCPVTITDRPDTLAQLEAGDRLLLYRFNCSWGDLTAALQAARSRGVVILSDVDDYLWHARGWTRERLLGCTRALRCCHAITCSTETLREQLQVMFPTVPMLLVPNSAPMPSPTLPMAASHTALRIGWTGAPWTRPDDLALLRPLAAWLQADPRRGQLVHLGHAEGHLSLAKALELPAAAVETVPLQSHADYLQRLNFDIGLAPLAQSSFNLYKSAIKVIEYSNQGIPWLASDTRPYQDLCQQWQWGGRLCESPESWISQLEPLLSSTEARLAEGRALQQLCQRHSSYGSGVASWRQVLSWTPSKRSSSSRA